MKKVYRKPIIVIEDFSLSTSIAGGCSIKTNTPCEGDCPYTVKSGFKEYAVFTLQLSNVCTTHEAALDGIDDGIYNGICYHTPIDEASLFNS